ncbi:MAG TPA: MATE family efflux transporter [Flavobacteriales bacterium]|nr:MATE family efflux transporter [Flavobacteriales bacterium]HIA13149.1 MATE family efflux transporter [Flavobacteriales bacterium]HIO72009.1 MATE family efflux transporter [Flavobacteriales bacterium]
MNSYKNIWNITYPIIIGMMAQNIVYMVDTAFLGRVGEVAQAAAPIAGMYYIAVFMLGMGFSTGAQIIIARRMGEGDLSNIGRVFDHSIYFLGAFALFIFCLLKFGTSIILDGPISSPEIYNGILEYMDYRSFGIFFAFINVAFRAFYVGIGNTKVLIWSTAAMAITNIVLDYALIFGEWGFPEMGIAGAALASVISEAVVTIYFLIHINLKRKGSGSSLLAKFQLLQPHQPDREQFRVIFKIGVPVMIQNFMSMGGWFLFYLVIEQMGVRSLATSNIIRAIYLIFMIPGIGLFSATHTLVSNTMGKGMIEEVLPLVRKIVIMGFSMTIPFVPITLLFPEAIISVFTNNAELISQTIPTLYVIALALVIMPISMITFGAVAGAGKTNKALIIEMLTLSTYLICTYLFAIQFEWEIHQVWYCELIYLIVIGSLSFGYLKWGNWRVSEL